MSNKQRDAAPGTVSGVQQINNILPRSGESHNNSDMSNKQRKTTIKRLIIFLVLAFLPFYIIIPTAWAYYGEPIFVSENANVQTTVYIFGVLGMMIPACANLITRLVTKEGFKNSYLGANFRGKAGYWAASVLVKLAESAVCIILIWAFYCGGMSFSDSFTGLNMQNTGLYLLQLAFSVICFFPAFGEEWGWRGYMMPKLMELMPKWAAVLVGGIIWGLWHAPLTVAGHNFGVDYDGYPWVGIGIMCVMCTLMNAFLTLLTEKTKSIYPASFCHMVNNNMSIGIIISLFMSEEAYQKLADVSMISIFIPYLAVIAATAAVSMVLLLHKKQDAENAEEKKAA